MNEQLKKELTGVGVKADSMTMDEFEELKVFYSPLMDTWGNKYGLSKNVCYGIHKYSGFCLSNNIYDFNTICTFKEFKEKYMNDFIKKAFDNVPQESKARVKEITDVIEGKDLTSVFRQWQKVKDTEDYLRIDGDFISLIDISTDFAIVGFNNHNEAIEYFESQMKKEISYEPTMGDFIEQTTIEPTLNDVFELFKEYSNADTRLIIFDDESGRITTSYSFEDEIFNFDNIKELYDWLKKELTPISTYDEAVKWLREKGNYWSKESSYFISYHNEGFYYSNVTENIDTVWKNYFTEEQKDDFFQTFGEVKK